MKVVLVSPVSVISMLQIGTGVHTIPLGLIWITRLIFGGLKFNKIYSSVIEANRTFFNSSCMFL